MGKGYVDKNFDNYMSVSYTHLDVYKRQVCNNISPLVFLA